MAQYYEFYEDGSTKKICLYYDGVWSSSFCFNEVGNVTSINLGDKYFENIIKHKDILDYPVFDNEDFCKDLQASERLILSGIDINRKIMNDLSLDGGLQNLTELILYSTSLTTDVIASIVNNSTVNVLDINSDQYDVMSILKCCSVDTLILKSGLFNNKIP